MSDVSEFTVVAVNECAAPQGTDDTKWSEYVIANRHTSIVGKSPGSLAQARRYARQFADELNARARGGHSVWAPRKQVTQPRKSADQ